MIYATCRYAPAELFAGFGEPVERLDPTPSVFSCAESCSHPNMCGFSKAVIEDINDRGIRRIVLTDCCDAMRRTCDVLKARDDMEFVHMISLPHLTGDREIRLFAGQLKALKDAYAAFSGIPFDLTKAEEAFRQSAVEKRTIPEGPWVAVDGAHASAELMRQIRAVFPDADVVNETCTGIRSLSYEPPAFRDTGNPSAEDSLQRESVSAEDDFFLRYARALLTQTYPCMRMLSGSTGRVEAGISAGQAGPGGSAERAGSGDSAQKTAQQNPPLGTIFHTIKFCDFYSFRYMNKKNSGAPLVKIETDSSLQSGGQLLTRLEAFREELDMKTGKDIAMKIQKKAGNGPVYTAGIDSGSTSTDAVIMNADRRILGRAIIPTGAGAVNTASRALETALDEAGLTRDDLASIVSTGYGRATIGIDGAEDVTEITCHARGAVYLDPSARTVIDIGGQDSKVISVDEQGHVLNFVMNDKCAAGTGRFLEQQARALELSMPEMSRRGLEWKKDISISSMCTVFAESEVVSLVARSVDTADIIHGLNKAIASKTAGLAARVKKKPGYILTGGVAKNEGVVKCLEEKLGAPVSVSPDAQLCGAIGAALIALDAYSL